MDDDLVKLTKARKVLIDAGFYLYKGLIHSPLDESWTSRPDAAILWDAIDYLVDEQNYAFAGPR